MKDKGFRLPSVPACSIAALNTASQLVEWMSKPESEEELGTFSRTIIVGHMKAYLSKRTTTKLQKTDKEAMWRSYHQLRTSASFQSLWKEFLLEAVAEVSLFYQYVTDQVFQALIKEAFQSNTSKTAASVDPKPLT